MNPQAALAQQISAEETVLYIFMDVSRSRWSLAFTDGSQMKFSSIVAGDFDELDERIEWAARKFKFTDDFRVISGYEAGDGFWVHRMLEKKGILNLVVDPGSFEERKNHGKRPKTDRLDARRGARKMVQFCGGDSLAFSPVRVPDPDDEDDRRLHRERRRRIKERCAHITRIKHLLANQGIVDIPDPTDEQWAVWLEDAHTPDGQPVGRYLKAELRRESKRLVEVDEMIAEIEAAQQAYLDEKADAKKAEMVEQLMWFKGIGLQTAWILVMEMFGWRNFENRRQLGSYVGLCGTPEVTGGRGWDKGIDKRGNTYVRWIAIEMAWSWHRWQPDSELSQWFDERFYDEGSRMRRRGIVGLARKLLNRLRVFLADGVVPRGAVLG